MDIPCMLYGEKRRRACRINAYEGILGAGRGDAAVVDFGTFPVGSSLKSKRYATLYYSDGKQITVQPDAQTMNQLREYFEELNSQLLEQADGE